MIEAVDGILGMTDGIDLPHFLSSPVLQTAIIHDLMVLDEAAAQMPDNVRAANSDIPWPRIVGMRNKLIHAYFGVDLDVVYVVATKTAPGLREPLERLRRSLEDTT